MSYLLTEIALEMLGYKFYDTNGAFHLINFQQSMIPGQCEMQAHPDEPSLMEFIDQPEPEKNGSDQQPMSVPPSNIKLSGTPVRALAKMMEYQTDKTTGTEQRPLQRAQQQEQQTPLLLMQQPQHQRKQQQMKRLSSSSETDACSPPKQASTVRRTPARALANIMEYENFNIRSQIKIRIDKCAHRDLVSLQACLKEEMKKLARDAKDVQEFRHFVEEQLKSTDPRPFETYLRTFGSE